MTGKEEQPLIEITEMSGKHILLKDNAMLESSEVMIKAAGEGSSNYLVYLTPESFVIFNIKKMKYAGGTGHKNAKVYTEVSGYSPATRTFIAKGYNAASGCDLYQIVNDEATFAEEYFLFASDERNGLRIVQLTNGKWIYFDSGRMAYCWKKTDAYNRKLGHRIKGFGTMYANKTQKFLWYYDMDKSRFISLFNIRYEDFTDIADSRYFVGCNKYTDACSQIRYSYRIMTRSREGGIIGSDELYSEYRYLPERNMFLVKAASGWTLITFNNQEESFEKVANMLYYKNNSFTFTDDFLIVTKEDGNVDIYDIIKGILYTIYWKTVLLSRIKDEEIILECCGYDGQNKRFPLSDIKIQYDYINRCLKSEYDKSHPALAEDGCTEKEENNMYIEYFCIGELKSKFQNGILCCNIDDDCAGDICIGSHIAFLDNIAGCLYIIKYMQKNTFKSVLCKELDATDYELFRDINECPLTMMERGISENEVLLYFRNNYNSLSCNDDKDETVQNVNSVNTETVIEEIPAAPESQKVQENRLGVSYLQNIRDCYRFLSKLDKAKNIYDAMFLLFKDDIRLLYGIDSHINEMLDELFDHSKIDGELSNKAMELITATDGCTEEFINKYKISLDYHRFVKGLGFKEAFKYVCQDLPDLKNVAGHLENYTDTLMDEKVNSNAEKVKEIISCVIIDSLS